MSEHAEPNTVLNYGLDRRRHRRLIKRIAIVAVLINLGLAGWWYGPHAMVFIKERYWQRACMNFNPSPETIVYERLSAGSVKSVAASPFVDGNGTEVFALRPRGYTSFFNTQQKEPVIAYRVPMCWVRFLQVGQHTTSTLPPTAVLFCHQRVSRSGHQRLITIEFPGKMSPPIGDILTDEMYKRVYPIAGWSGCTQLQIDDSSTIFDIRGILPLPRRIFAGQPDHADSSHFTIQYEWPNGVGGVIDGWLRDSDQVDLTIRPGPGDIESAQKSVQEDPKSWGVN